MERLKILFVTYAYPPLKYPRSVQISHLVQYLRKSIDVTVMASRPDTNDDRSLLNFTSLNNVVYPEKTWLTRFFDKIGGYRIKEHFLPDTFYLESRELCISSRKLLQQEKYNAIVTFGQPMSLHIAGLKLKKKYPPIPWIAHFSDPWVDNPYNKKNAWVQCLNQSYQDQVFKYADKLLFTSLETIDLAMRNYQEDIRKKAIYLPHSFNPKLYPPKHSKVNNTFVVRYLGNFYGQRQPDSLFQALQILKSKNALPDFFQVELIGVDVSYLEKAKENGIDDIVTVKPMVDYLTSLKLMSESDLLLVIDAPMEISPFFPSKLVDYIGANRPILGITPEGASKRIIEEFGLLTANPKNSQDIANKLLEMISRVCESNYKVSSAIQNQFSIEVVGLQIASLLEKSCF